MTSRQDIGIEVDEDLAKSPHQLLVDVHEELLHDGRSPHENMVHAQKRLASLFVKWFEASDRQQEVANRLARWIRTLTWVMVGVGLLQIAVALLGLCR